MENNSIDPLENKLEVPTENNNIPFLKQEKVKNFLRNA